MNIRNFLKLSSLALLASASTLSAVETLLTDGTKNFNVTLTLSPTYSLNVDALDFGTINPTTITAETTIKLSSTKTLSAFSNGAVGHKIKIVASDDKYKKTDGTAFLMTGVTSGNNDVIAFVLDVGVALDGKTAAPGGNREILPGDTVVSVDGSDENNTIAVDIWASLTDNAQLKLVSADSYLAVLTAEHYSVQ